jgi:RNA polymerase sigma-70 factor (ECF subfamily)
MDNDLNIKIDAQEEFDALFHEYSDVIYRLCLFKTSNESVAHDLTQETFLRLWKSMSSDKDIEKPKQYIYQIARNLIVDYYKRHKTLSLELLEETGFEPKSEGNSQETLAEISILKDFIETLEQEFRDVLYLRFIEDMKVQDIAEILNISENLASVRISRGKEKLRLKFD